MAVFTKNATFDLPSPVWGRTGPGFSQITRVSRNRSSWNLHLSSLIWHIRRKLQIDVMSGHPVMTSYGRSWSAEIGIFCVLSNMGELSCFLAYDYVLQFACGLMESKYHIQLTQGQGHASKGQFFSLFLVNLVVTSSGFCDFEHRDVSLEQNKCRIVLKVYTLQISRYVSRSSEVKDVGRLGWLIFVEDRV